MTADLFCMRCGAPARDLRSRPTLDVRYPLVRCKRGHHDVGTSDAELAEQIATRWAEDVAAAKADDVRRQYAERFESSSTSST